MKLWLLTPNPTRPHHRVVDPFTRFDNYVGFLIRAESEERARHLANIEAADEGLIWDQPEWVDCVEVTADGEETIILSSFNAA